MSFPLQVSTCCQRVTWSLLENFKNAKLPGNVDSWKYMLFEQQRNKSYSYTGAQQWTFETRQTVVWVGGLSSIFLPVSISFSTLFWPVRSCQWIPELFLVGLGYWDYSRYLSCCCDKVLKSITEEKAPFFGLHLDGIQSITVVERWYRSWKWLGI